MDKPKILMEMVFMKYNTCLNCEKRHYNCHTDCKDYNLYKKHLEEMKKKKEMEQIVPTHSRRRKRVYER